jgi:hypothetical protein
MSALTSLLAVAVFAYGAVVLVAAASVLGVWVVPTFFVVAATVASFDKGAR